MKNNNCFYCLNHNAGKGVLAENTGWYHQCTLGIKNEDLQEVEKCPSYKPNKGFQIGGYYTHMDIKPHGDCLIWTIHGDGEFPKTDPSEFIELHICDFEQIEYFVEFWGKHLREKGIIPERK